MTRRCGACRHEHGFGIKCSCGCATFELHPDDEASLREQVAREAAEYSQGTVLTAEGSDAVLRSLDQFESELMDQFDWDQMPPLLFVVRIGRGPDSLLIGLESLRLPDTFWGQAQTPADVLYATAVQAVEQPRWFANFRRGAGLDPKRPVVGWGFAYEGYLRKPGVGGRGSARDNPAIRLDESRAVIFVDVDERIYDIQRFRFGTHPRQVHVITPRGYSEVLEMIPEQEPEYSGIPRIPEALRLLARTSAQEVEVRNAFSAQG